MSKILFNVSVRINFFHPNVKDRNSSTEEGIEFATSTASSSFKSQDFTNSSMMALECPEDAFANLDT